jgi:hypothetical protein
MAGSSKPGPLCNTRGASSIDAGTLTLSCSPSPGPVCSTRLPDEMTDISAERNATIAIRTLLTSCLAPATSLNESDYSDASKALGVDVETIRAVTKVEDPKHDLIYYEGRPTILFERHHFHESTGGAWDKTNARISSPSAGGYGKFRWQYDKLTEAYGLDASAALESVSWGKFQLLGKHYKDCGFGSVEEMVASLMKSERNQLDAFVTWLRSEKNAKMLAALRNHSWTAFAKLYNGSGYAKNKYDSNLQAAYEAEVQKKPKGKPAVTPPAINIVP